jgi:hypothetical protein
MYAGIIQSAISTRLRLELDYRKPSDWKNAVALQESAPGIPDYFDRAQSHEIEFDRLLSLI